MEGAGRREGRESRKRSVMMSLRGEGRKKGERVYRFYIGPRELSEYERSSKVELRERKRSGNWKKMSEYLGNSDSL